MRYTEIQIYIDISRERVEWWLIALIMKYDINMMPRNFTLHADS